jgi:hypothetical protein
MEFITEEQKKNLLIVLLLIIPILILCDIGIFWLFVKLIDFVFDSNFIDKFWWCYILTLIFKSIFLSGGCSK